MNDFRTFFQAAKAVNQYSTPRWQSNYYRYAPFHVEYCKISLKQNPVLGIWTGAVSCEYTEHEKGKKEMYKSADGYSPVEVIEKLEKEVREWLGESVYGEREEGA